MCDSGFMGSGGLFPSGVLQVPLSTPSPGGDIVFSPTPATKTLLPYGDTNPATATSLPATATSLPAYMTSLPIARSEGALPLLRDLVGDGDVLVDQDTHVPRISTPGDTELFSSDTVPDFLYCDVTTPF